jgi:phosphocarrier protein HPr
MGMTQDSASAHVEIKNMMGIHLRPASSLVQLSNRYPDCEVAITKDGQTVDGKSIMSVIMLAANQGSMLIFEVRGPDCEQLLKDLVALVDSKFGED